MAEIVDRHEVERVIEGIAAPLGMAGAPEGAARVSGLSYDFSHPDLLSREQTRAIRTLHDGYAQALAKRLSTELLATVTASVASVNHLTYSEFLTLLPTPTVLAVVNVPELDGTIAIDLNPGLAFSFVDRLLGGPGAPLGKTRALSAIEAGLMERVFRRSCQEMSGVWRPIMELRFELTSIEGNPELARVVSPEEMVVLISVELAMNDVKGMLNLCLPYVVMEPAIHRLGQGTPMSRGTDRDAREVRGSLSQSLRFCPVGLDVDLGSASLTLRQILDLETGDVLRIGPAAKDGAVAMVQGVPRLVGTPGTHRGRRALRVTAVRSVHP
ncbi:MAG: flagellar motor switch protein FliM [Candidatus Eiseniibacteriota bacterium]